MSSMEKLSPVISSCELPGSPWSNTWTTNSPSLGPQSLLLGPVGALEQRRRQTLDRLLARGNVRHDQRLHRAMQPDLREQGRFEVTLER